MKFGDAVKLCFTKYAEFNGRARRPEFWWYALFIFLATFAAGVLGRSASALVSLVTLVPSLAVGARRLHDTNRSGWWQLLGLIPLIGWVLLIIFLAQEGNAAENRYGGPPPN